MSRSSMQSWWQQANLQAKHRKSGKVSWLFDIFGIWRSFNRRRPRHRCHKPHTRHADITPHRSFRTWLLPLADNSAYGQIYFFPLRLLPSVFPTHTLAYIIWPQLACFRIKVALVQFTLLCFAGGSNERCRRRDSGRHSSHKNRMRTYAAFHRTSFLPQRLQSAPSCLFSPRSLSLSLSWRLSFYSMTMELKFCSHSKSLQVPRNTWLLKL